MKRIIQLVLGLIVLFVVFVGVTQSNTLTGLVRDVLGLVMTDVTEQLPVVEDVLPAIEGEIPIPTIDVPAIAVEGNTIRLTEAEINGLVGNFGNEQVQVTQVRLVPDQIVLVLTVAGLSTELTANLAAIDGQVVVQNPALSGVAGSLIPIDELVGPLQAAINQVIAQNAPVKSIRVENGAVEVELNR